MRGSTKTRIHVALWIAIAALAYLLQSEVISGPLPWLAFGMLILAEMAMWWHFRIRYLDFVLVPLRPEQLPRDVYRTFDRLTPEFMALRCGLIGDFQLSYLPWPTWVRYFFPPDRRIRGEVSQSDETSAPSFVTVFDDGRVIETARLDSTEQPAASAVPVAAVPLTNDSYGSPQVEALLASFVATYFGSCLAEGAAAEENPMQCREDRMLWAQVAPGLPLEELFALHVRTIDLYESNYGARALTVTPDRLLDFAQYDHRLLWFQRHALPARYGVPQPPVGKGQMTKPQ